jgi:hypothetical protein
MEHPCCVGVIRSAEGLTGQLVTEAGLPIYTGASPRCLSSLALACETILPVHFNTLAFLPAESATATTVGVVVVHDIFGLQIPNTKFVVDWVGRGT